LLLGGIIFFVSTKTQLFFMVGGLPPTEKVLAKDGLLLTQNVSENHPEQKLFSFC